MDELGFACRAVSKTKPLRSGLWDFGLFPDCTRSCRGPEQAWLAASGAQAAAVGGALGAGRGPGRQDVVWQGLWDAVRLPVLSLVSRGGAVGAVGKSLRPWASPGEVPTAPRCAS